jgi:hypothetical protein
VVLPLLFDIDDAWLQLMDIVWVLVLFLGTVIILLGQYLRQSTPQRLASQPIAAAHANPSTLSHKNSAQRYQTSLKFTPPSYLYHSKARSTVRV